MEYQLSDYQTTVETAVLGLAERFRTPPMLHDESFVYSETLDAELAESGFHEVSTDPELGLQTAALVTMEIAKLPVCVEVAASTMVRPQFFPEVPRPIALADRTNRPIRFLPQAKTLVLIEDGAVKTLELAPSDVTPIASLFAYPYGRLSSEALDRAVARDVDANALRRQWQVAIAAEIWAALDGGLALTIDYVTQRKQFGQPIGAFQAVKHRLAEVAVLSHTLKWLTLRAASNDAPEDALIACGYAQDAATQAAHELHQFHGATGMTLEYPLHLWSYRLKALVSELGGADTQTAALADALWGAAA
ncbi:acyl-CoA dehydrogenase family protein [Amorphus sp. 3PC139-8]|uniref:acyl-CoA dehydrogenase family protein n=1 Tax=Amorphus sp. 3PC139-8 TaxID=2735676 RepID=UPI00345C8DBD